jgi:hypothetical protein
MADSLEDRIVQDSYEPTDEDLPMVYGARVIPTLNNRSLPMMQTSTPNLSVSLAGSQESILQVLQDNHLFDPAVITERQPFFWPTEISSSRLDSYDTRMDPETTLPNYAEDAAAGVSFCDSHNHMEQAFGRSFAGLLVNSGNQATAPGGEDPENPPTVYAAWYTFPGLKLNRVNTDDLIFGIRSGLVKDISVGFKPDKGFMYRCSVCGENLWSWDCSHIPGDTTSVVVNESTGQTEERYVFSWVVNARLSEGSGVYDGATPRCMILKATREARIGRIPERALRMVESMARIQLPRKRALLPGKTTYKDEERTMPEDKEKEQEFARAMGDQRSLKALLQQVRGLLTIAKVEVEEDATPEQLFRCLKDHNTALTERAERGDKMFEVLVNQALDEGERAQSDKFDKDKWKNRLNKMDPEDVEEMRSGWKEKGDEILGQGGRKTRDGGEDKELGGEEAKTRSAATDDEEDSSFDSIYAEV